MSGEFERTPHTLFQVPPPQKVLQPVMMHSAKRSRGGDTLDADTPFGPTSLSRIPPPNADSISYRSFDRQGVSNQASSRIPMPATALGSANG